MWGVSKLPHICLFADRGINKGEELAFDYNWEVKATTKERFKKIAHECKCGGDECKKFIDKSKHTNVCICQNQIK